MRSLALAITTAAVLLAACASPAVPTLESSSPAPSVAATRSPRTATPSPSSSQAVVIPHADPALEARLPDEVDGKTLTKLSVGPSSVTEIPGAKGMVEVAKEIGDGSGNFGLAYAGDPDAKFNLFALHVPGADASTLATKFAQMTYAETIGGRVEAATLGGRQVVHVIDPFSEIGDVWFYADGDTILGVQAGSPAQATELLALIS